jgi:hypothetical protein
MRFPGYGRGTTAGNLTEFPAAIARGKHPVPFRTRKLSLSAPMVLRGRPRGRAGHRRNTPFKRADPIGSALFCVDTSSRGGAKSRASGLIQGASARLLGARRWEVRGSPAPPDPLCGGPRGWHPFARRCSGRRRITSMPAALAGTTAGQRPRGRAFRGDLSPSPAPVAHPSHRFPPLPLSPSASTGDRARPGRERPARPAPAGALHRPG